MSSTVAFANYKNNIERLELFMTLSRSLDPDQEAVRMSKAAFMTQIRSDVLSSIKEKLTNQNSNLIYTPELLLAEAANIQQKEEEDAWQRKVDLYHELRFEIHIVQLVTISEIYISDVLNIIFKKNNSLLLKDQNKEEELNSMKYIDILKYHSIDDLKEELIQRKVVQILKRSIRRMMRFFIETFTNDIIANTAELDMIEKMWDTRNLIVHQNGIIDLAYSKKYNLVKGNRVLVNNDFINDHYRNIEKLFSNIDKAAFKLP